MTPRADASGTPAPAGHASAHLRSRGAVGPLHRGLASSVTGSGRASLARRFLAASLAILLVAGVAVGVWVGDQLERGIVERTGSVTALYVESIIEPSVESMADGSPLTPAEIEQLDAHLARTALLEDIVSLRIWSPEGEVVYSTNPGLIGRWFPVADGLAAAWGGAVTVAMDDLSGDENAWERARWDRLLEMYIPVRERGSDRVIAVAEFYQDPTAIDREVGEARLGSWLVVSLAIVVSALLLFGIVKGGSDTIVRQEAALTRQVEELTALVERNAALTERVRTAAERTTTLNERSLRRVSADLHDGPGQMLSLALLRLDAVRSRVEQGRSPDATELAAIEDVLREAMTDMRAVAAGLRLPQLEGLGVAEVAARAVDDHRRRSSVPVELTVGDVPDEVVLPVRIALFRALQEALSNATRHGRGIGLRVRLAAEPAATGRPGRLVLEVSDSGPGFDPDELEASAGLGLAGIREQAELLGGGFEVRSGPGTGTDVRVWWPVNEHAAEAAR
jgi:signal transduction histidine kinase